MVRDNNCGTDVKFCVLDSSAGKLNFFCQSMGGGPISLFLTNPRIQRSSKRLVMLGRGAADIRNATLQECTPDGTPMGALWMGLTTEADLKGDSCWLPWATSGISIFAVDWGNAVVFCGFLVQYVSEWFCSSVISLMLGLVTWPRLYFFLSFFLFFFLSFFFSF